MLFFLIVTFDMRIYSANVKSFEPIINNKRGGELLKYYKLLIKIEVEIRAQMKLKFSIFTMYYV